MKLNWRRNKKKPLQSFMRHSLWSNYKYRAVHADRIINKYAWKPQINTLQNYCEILRDQVVVKFIKGKALQVKQLF